MEQSPANSAGGLFEMRHLANPILGFEGTYSYNRANQGFKQTSCPSSYCPPITVNNIKAAAHEVTLDWVPSLKVLNFSPFGVLGVGVLAHVPQGTSTVETKTSTKGVFVYGAGLDWGVLPHLGLRFQYRGNLTTPPEVTNLYTSSRTFTQTAEPMVGVYFHL